MLEIPRGAGQIGSLALFLAFLALGLRVAFSREKRRSAANHLLVFTIAVYAVLAISQRDAWPFSSYPLMAVISVDRGEIHTMLAAKGVDASGREWGVDPLAWSPLYPPSTLAWFDVSYPNATPAQRETVLRFLLQRAEAARISRIENRNFGNRALLGPLAAPDIYVYGSVDPSPTPFKALRIYRLSWNPSAFVADGRRVTRTQICEFRE